MRKTVSLTDFDLVNPTKRRTSIHMYGVSALHVPSIAPTYSSWFARFLGFTIGAVLLRRSLPSEVDVSNVPL
jgi:hypothetical protein